MREVSDEYKKAMHGSSHRFKLSGTIGDTYTFDDSNVVQGSFSYSIQNTTSNSSIEIGTACIGSIEIVLCGSDIPKYTIEGMDINITISRYISDTEEWESVSLTPFIINNPTWTKQGIKITGYDYMSKLTKDLSIDTTIGTPYELLTYICDSVGLTFGMTQEDVEALPNGTKQLGMYTESNIETCQDFVAELSMVLGAWAAVDPEGKLILKTYNTDVVDTIKITDRMIDAEFADYKTFYSCVSYTYLKDGYNYVIGDTEADGLVFKMGENAFMQYGTDDVIEARAQAVLDAITCINFVPFTLARIFEPAYEIGDVISCTGGLADDEALHCINIIDWTYNDKIDIEGTGSNPALIDARSKVDKNLTGLLSQTESNKVAHYKFANSSDISIGDGETVLISTINFTAEEAEDIDIHGTIIMDTELAEEVEKGNVKVTYVFNDEEISFYPTETYDEDGYHFLTLYKCLEAVPDSRNTLKVYLTCGSMSAKVYSGNAEIVITGQGMAATAKWDGTIEIEESVDLIPNGGGLKMIDFAESLTANTQTPVGATLAQSIGLIPNGGGLSMLNFNDDLTILIPEADKTYLITSNDEYIETDKYKLVETTYQEETEGDT